MYHVERENNNIFLLLMIIALVVLFTILAYTLFLDSNKYQYTEKVVGTKIYNENENNNNLDEILNNTIECTVGISKIKNAGSTIFLENSTENLGLGSGVIVSQGYILTNQHVAGDKYSPCYVTMQNGVTDTGVVVWSSEDLDLAIIKINMKDLPEAKMGDSENIKIGNTVYAIGNPVGYELQRTVTSGIISGIDRTIKLEEENKKTYMEGLIQTDATINQGNSGGPLINQNGEVIGITTIKIDDAEGIGFAIPINIVKPIIKKLTEKGEFIEPYLGIYGYDKQAIPYLSTNLNFDMGIYIEEIDATGPLYNSGLMKGDILEKIDDMQIESMNKLKEYIFSKNVGDNVKLTIKRKKEIFEINVILGKT